MHINVPTLSDFRELAEFTRVLDSIDFVDEVAIDFKDIKFTKPACLVVLAGALRTFKQKHPNAKRRVTNHRHLTYAAHVGFFKYFGVDFGLQQGAAAGSDTYVPLPANKGAETSCTAAIADTGEWLRIFPVPYRSLPTSKRFSKYQWVNVDLMKATGDARPESLKINIDTLVLGEKLPTDNSWEARRAIVKPLMNRSLCAIRKERDEKRYPTLGIFRPKTIKRLTIKKAKNPNWTPKQKAILGQTSMGFLNAPTEELEKIPYDFIYEFTCEESGCRGHKVSCTDWEMAEAYRKWRMDYGQNGWEAKFREKFERDMTEKFDTHFYVGTMHHRPSTWLIVGLFYPPKKAPNSPFSEVSLPSLPA